MAWRATYATLLVVLLLGLGLQHSEWIAQSISAAGEAPQNEASPNKGSPNKGSPAEGSSDKAAKQAAADPDSVPKPPPEDYYELYRMLAETVDQVERNYIKDISRRELMEAAIEGILRKLDPYSSYIDRSQLQGFREGVESEFAGIGVQVTIEDNRLTVISPIVGSPAYQAGLQAGDQIIRVEGQSVIGITIDEAIKRLKGPPGSKVKFTVWHPHSGKEETLKVTRQVIHMRTVLGDHHKKNDAWDYFLTTDEQKIAYIRITAFSRETARELRRALVQLKAQKMRGLVLDLRFNPGGLLSSAIEISDLFLSSGKIVSTKGRNAPERSWSAHKKGTFEGFPMAVLINRYSASASEILAACLQDHQRAIVVGSRSWGKGSVQNVIELDHGRSALKLTTASYHRPSGKNIHRFPNAKESDEWGVTPSDGFGVKLAPEEMTRMIQIRRDRDVLMRRDPVSGEQSGPRPPEPPVAVDQTNNPIDKQLRKALDYLESELATAKQKTAK